MFDFLSPVTDILGTIAQWVGYGIIFTAVVGALFLLVAIPIMVKMAAVAVARTAIVETAKLLSESGMAASFNRATDAVTRASNELTQQIQKQNAKQDFEVRVIEDVEVN